MSYESLNEWTEWPVFAFWRHGMITISVSLAPCEGIPLTKWQWCGVSMCFLVNLKSCWINSKSAGHLWGQRVTPRAGMVISLPKNKFAFKEHPPKTTSCFSYCDKRKYIPALQQCINKPMQILCKPWQIPTRWVTIFCKSNNKIIQNVDYHQYKNHSHLFILAIMQLLMRTDVLHVILNELERFCSLLLS